MLDIPTYTILFVIIVILPICLLIIYFRDLFFGPAIPAKLKPDIKPDPKDIIGFINSSEGSINIVAGEMDPTGYTSDVFDAIEIANKRGLKIFVIAGPVMLYDENAFPKMAKLIKEGLVEFYVSLRRQDQHFYVDGGGRLFFEEKHDPSISTRTIISFPYNKFEAHWYRKKFRKILQSNEVKKFTPPTDILLVKKEDLVRLKTFLNLLGKKFSEFTFYDFKNLMDKENIDYHLWSKLCQSLGI